MDFNATLAWNDPTRKGSESEWPDLERTGMRQFCDFHSTEQQILANPELQARRRSVHAAADIRHPWTEDLLGGLAAPVQPYVFCPAMNLWNPSKNMPLHI